MAVKRPRHPRKYRPIVRLAEDMGFDTQAELAETLGWHRNSLNDRLMEKVEWTGKDIRKMCEVLRIPQERIGALFFPDVPCMEGEGADLKGGECNE